jgi:hypothetical protein
MVTGGMAKQYSRRSGRQNRHRPKASSPAHPWPVQLEGGVQSEEFARTSRPPRGGKRLLADIPQPTEEAPRRRIVVRHLNEQTSGLGANLGAITVFVRRPELPHIHAQFVIILPGAQFSPAPQIPLAEVHATSDRLPRESRCLPRWLGFDDKGLSPPISLRRRRHVDQPGSRSRLQRQTEIGERIGRGNDGSLTDGKK